LTYEETLSFEYPKFYGENWIENIKNKVTKAAPTCYSNWQGIVRLTDFSMDISYR